jgi:hypothetical protein
MPRYCENSIVPVLLLTFFCTTAQGQEPTQPDQTSFKSACNWEPPEFYEQVKRLAPWFTKLNRQITNEPGFNALSKAMINLLSDGRCITCYLMLEKDGSLKKLDVFDDWGPTLKEPTDVFLRRAAPFVDPPSEILYPRQVMVKFERNGDSIRVLSYLFPIR